MTLEADRVSWRRGGRLVVDGVSLRPAPGSTVGLLGPNGSGKSSLLRLLQGTAAPDTGVVTLDGALIGKLGCWRLPEIGFLFDPAQWGRGYAAEAMTAFIARRRALRPSEEYRTPTDEEWAQFVGHFEQRKVAVGDCGRSYDTPCIHEHSCLRCPLLRPDPAARFRADLLALQRHASAALGLVGAAPFDDDELTPLPGSRELALLRARMHHSAADTRALEIERELLEAITASRRDLLGAY